MSEQITPQMVIWAYTQGIFPMSRSRHSDVVEWFCPDPRAIMPLETFHVPRSLAKVLRRGTFAMTRDRAFAEVMRQCAKPRKQERDTWINDAIVDAYIDLHERGFAHSVEAWCEGELVGGLYGVALGGAFFGESMFSRQSNASKVCLVHLVEHLRERGFTLLDVQFHNKHLAQFGVEEIARDAYLARLADAMQLEVAF